MSEVAYTRVDKIIVSDKKITILYTDYRDQDKSKEQGRYEMKKKVEIPGVGPKSLELAFKKLVPHVLNNCHLGQSEDAKKTTRIISVQFKGEHRDTIVPVFELEDVNLKPFKVVGPEMYVHEAEKSKSFKNAIADLQAEIDEYLGVKDLPVQLKIDFSEKVSKN